MEWEEVRVMEWEEVLLALTPQVMELGEWVALPAMDTDLAEAKTVMEWEEVTAFLEWVVLTVVDTDPTEAKPAMKWKEVQDKALPQEMAEQEHPMAHGKIIISPQ